MQKIKKKKADQYELAGRDPGGLLPSENIWYVHMESRASQVAQQ